MLNVSHAMSCTPSWVSCMNSKFLFTTVLRNFQWALRKRGYWPTMYMILDATTALLSLPRFISQRPSRSLITVTRNRFSVSSFIAPEMDPIAQQSVLRLAQDHSEPSTCFASFSVMMFSVSSTSRCVRYTSTSRIALYSTIVSDSLRNSRTISPSSFSTTSTSSGFTMRSIITSRRFERMFT